MTSSHQSIWAPEFETLSEQERRAVEAPLIARQIQYVYQHSEFYRTRMADAGVAADEIADQQSLAALPLLEKSDITYAQREGALFGPHQCVDFRDIVRVGATGGSSGQPTRLAWTRSDIELYNEMGARALWTMGCRPGEMVINCFNYSAYTNTGDGQAAACNNAWLFFSYLIMFGCIIASVWVMVEYWLHDQSAHSWPGIAGVIQTSCLTASATVVFIGRESGGSRNAAGAF